MNGTKAYREVYPSIKSDDVAGAAAARLLGNVRVQARIAEIMRAGAERAEVTVEQVVRELKLIGFSDIRKVVSWRNELVTRTEKGKDGEPVLMPRVTIVDADKISDEAAAAVAEVSQTVNGALRVKLHDKHAALVSIGKHLGMFVDRVQIQERKQISAEPMSAEEWKRQYVREG
jgi:phage terminase small subunit